MSNANDPIFPVKLVKKIYNQAKQCFNYKKVEFPGLTIKDYACIKLKVPETEKKWLNDVIKASEINPPAKHYHYIICSSSCECCKYWKYCRIYLDH